MQASETRIYEPGASCAERERSLDELIEIVNGLTEAPSLADVTGWFNSCLLRQRDYERHRLFSDHNYARNLVVRSPFAEMLFLCWRPGQRTPIHDHGGSIGVVLVCEGMMTETMYEHAPEGNVRPYTTFRRGPAAITGADVPDIHQLINLEPEGRDLVTLHCYAPPLSVLNTYSQSSSRIGHWREPYYSGGAGI
ncbi:MAG TPA: cysteine dioxygenase family protein [Blastocatellia bacterium]|nr:cysteine dioxygenase family protein [Blastocatellia bacterium]